MFLFLGFSLPVSVCVSPFLFNPTASTDHTFVCSFFSSFSICLCISPFVQASFPRFPCVPSLVLLSCPLTLSFAIYGGSSLSALVLTVLAFARHMLMLCQIDVVVVVCATFEPLFNDPGSLLSSLNTRFPPLHCRQLGNKPSHQPPPVPPETVRYSAPEAGSADPARAAATPATPAPVTAPASVCASSAACAVDSVGTSTAVDSVPEVQSTSSTQPDAAAAASSVVRR